MDKKCPYINRDDVAQMLIEGVLENNSSPQYAEYIRMLVYSVPSADVAPVRHGWWIVGEQMPMHDIKGNLSWGNWYTCDQCEFKTYAIEHHITQYNYCPNCGAKMDEGETKE